MQAARIREVFREALKSKGVDLANDFSWHELTRKTKQKKVEFAFAFLKAALTTQCEQGTIEEAIAGGTRGKMIGNRKHLRKDDVFQAASEFFPGFKEKCGQRSSMQIDEIIDEISNLIPPQK
jgi:delta 1-pyrroline-5-carboxylate dehydrogenase